MLKKPRVPDPRAARLRAQLADRGLSCTALDQREDLYPGQTANALYEPDEAGERAIAQALGRPPQEIWPERFGADGIRHVPQPPENYRSRNSESRRNARMA